MQTVAIQPRFSETDAMGHINNTSIAVWFETARVEYLMRIGERLQQWSPTWVLASLQLDYLRECHFGHEVSVEVSVTKIGNASLTLSCRMYQGGELKVVGNCVLVHFDAMTRKSAPLPDALRALLEHEVLSFQRMEKRAAS